jgi:hypothetical protein
MKIPGFDAEASLNRIDNRFRASDTYASNEGGVYPALCQRETLSLLLDLCDRDPRDYGCYRRMLNWCIKQ